MRNPYLDFLKGVAIILVVVGHGVQYAHPSDFDEVFWFRLIYSFHMPLFFFLAGWTNSIYRNNPTDLSLQKTSLTSAKFFWDLLNRAQRLVLPFFSWGIILYFGRANYASMPFADYLRSLIAAPDNGLWFLPVLFFCHAAFIIGWNIFLFLKPSKYGPLSFFSAVFFLLLSYWLLLRSPDVLGIGLARHYFIYYVIGFIWGISKFEVLPRWIHEFIFILFPLILPLWHRENPSKTFADLWAYLHLPYPEQTLKLLVAITGIYIFIQSMKIAYQGFGLKLNNALIYLGKRTLEVYAIHIFFLGTFQGIYGIIFAIFVSLSMSIIIRQSRTLAFMFLGSSMQNFSSQTKV